MEKLTDDEKLVLRELVQIEAVETRREIDLIDEKDKLRRKLDKLETIFIKLCEES
jgi:hypothetical protein